MAFTPDAWTGLRAFTGARIALGRAGGSLPTAEWLAFRLAHARARDAVWRNLDHGLVSLAAAAVGLDVVEVASAAEDRQTFLRRPDLGRRLAPGCTAILAAAAATAKPFDVALLVSGGLSAAAVEAQLAPVLAALVPELKARALTVSPLVLVAHGRVGSSDEAGAALGAKCALMLIGER